MRKTTLIILAILASLQLSAQGFLSFYQLRDIVPQSSNFQPAFIPDNTLTIGLPTNLGVTLQGDVTLQQLLSKAPGSNDFTLNFNVLNAAANELNRINLQADVNLLHLDLKTKVGAFSLFANLRSNFDFVYNKDMIEFLANGNGNSIGGTLDFTGSTIRMDAFQEIGIGYARKFLDDKLTVGLRLKLVTGMYHASIQEDAGLQLTTNADDFNWQIAVQNGTVNTAGLDYFFNSDDYESSEMTSYMLSNGNQTLALDFGFRYRPIEKVEIEAAFNDIGKIEWTEQARNYNTGDTEFTFSGIALRGVDDQEQAIQDSLTNKFTSNETQETFSTTMARRMYLAGSFFLTANDRFSITYFLRNALSNSPGNVAVSYNHRFKKFVVGVLGSSRGANNDINFGANLGTNIGPVQMYLALDNALVLNRPEQYSKADVRFGLNLMLGYKKWLKAPKIVDLDKL